MSQEIQVKWAPRESRSRISDQTSSSDWSVYSIMQPGTHTGRRAPKNLISTSFHRLASVWPFLFWEGSTLSCGGGKVSYTTEAECAPHSPSQPGEAGSSTPLHKTELRTPKARVIASCEMGFFWAAYFQDRSFLKQIKSLVYISGACI